MDQPLSAHSWAETQYYLMVTPCPSCGKGPWRVVQTGPEGRGVDVAATCQACGAAQTFRFAGDRLGEQATHLDQPVPVNPTDQPSRIIDVGQWLSLFYLFVDNGANSRDKSATRRLGYQAAQCLAEALRFYGDNELPPPEAFFIDASGDAFREHPERFARQRLCDLQAKLPPLNKMANRVARDNSPGLSGGEPKRKWWRFWRR